MHEIADRIFQSKFNKAVAKSFVVTVVFFATLDQFVTAILKNYRIIILIVITFYLLFNVFAFYQKNGKKSSF